MNIAKVIVDVPANVVNQTFDYRIPEKLLPIIQPGMRVVVPFGPRKVSGFVMELVDEASFEHVKDIDGVFEVHPVLTEELLRVGKWLAEKTVSLYITTFQAMLPQVLKAKYEKEINVMNWDLLPEELKGLFINEEKLPYDQVIDELSSLNILKEAINEGALKINYLVRSQAKKQYERIIYPAKKAELKEALATVRSQATRQRQILSFFIEQHEPIVQSLLYEKLSITRNHLNPLIERGLLTVKKEEKYRNPYVKKIERSENLTLNNEQAKVLAQISETIKAKTHRTYLLHGVTGSGKTEIYLQAIEKVIHKRQEAIVLVPEISLTPQMVHRFKSRFGDRVAVMHSGLSVGEKYDEWRKIQRKEVQVVVGARSAIFAPFENLGIIIIDEEHETTYKQEESPRYHAKDVAIKRGQLNNCPVVLGSATPTLEAYARAEREVYELTTLNERINKKPMPPVEIIDMRDELHAGNRTMFSRTLIDKMINRIEKGEQIVLLLNRRGYSNFVLCRDCGYVDECPSCDISLTYHKRDHRLKCHYCMFEKALPHVCPDCESDRIRFFGTGTERVQEALYKAIPGIRIIRMDVDTTRRKGAHEQLLDQFARKQADVLLGTQMIAKGLDFENVTLVGVLAADSMLHLPDFRSSERTFQLITQVSGRAGRHELDGEVIVQTYTPDHYSIQLASEYDYIAFYREEMRLRRTFRYPPYYYLALLNFAHENNAKVYTSAHKASNVLSRYLSQHAIVLGPTASPIARLKNRYRYQMIVKYRREPYLQEAMRAILESLSEERRRGLRVTVDLNPYQFM